MRYPRNSGESLHEKWRKRSIAAQSGDDTVRVTDERTARTSEAVRAGTSVSAKARSVSHCVSVSARGVDEGARSGVFAVGAGASVAIVAVVA